MLLFLTGLAVCLPLGISIIVPMLLGFFCFAGCALHRGSSWRDVTRMAARGMKKTTGVIKIFILIGFLTAVWRAGGTIAFLVWYGIRFIEPRVFLLGAFVLSCLVSYALGSCFGTSGTIGVVLMILARSGGVDPVLTAGVILSGAFFGDRCAPTSSSANLVATLTGTFTYDNVRAMFRTAFLPTLLTLLIYFYCSLRHPLAGGSPAILSEIAGLFDLSPVTMLPALVVFVLPVLGVGVKTAIALSVVSGAAVALWVQHVPLSVMARALFLGYYPDAPGLFARIVAGGGLVSMLKVMGIVLIASTYSGIFEEVRLLDGVQRFLERLSRRVSLYPATAMASVVTSAFACNQTLAVILTHQLMGKIYERQGAPPDLLAIHLEDTVILIAGLIPWSIASGTALTAMSAGVESIPFAVFLWLVPLMNGLPDLKTVVQLYNGAKTGAKIN